MGQLDLDRLARLPLRRADPLKVLIDGGHEVRDRRRLQHAFPKGDDEARAHSWLAWSLGFGFIAFGFWTLVPDRPETEGTPPRWGPLLTSIVVFFVAEMGDKTQLATLALGARFDSTATVTAGTTFGMLVADGLAVFAGDRLAAIVPMRTVRWIAAAFFFAFGVAAIGGTRWILLAPGFCT